jgi:hypothetical protein
MAMLGDVDGFKLFHDTEDETWNLSVVEDTSYHEI